jgi:hypothetical protein
MRPTATCRVPALSLNISGALLVTVAGAALSPDEPEMTVEPRS